MLAIPAKNSGPVAAKSVVVGHLHRAVDCGRVLWPALNCEWAAGTIAGIVRMVEVLYGIAVVYCSSIGQGWCSADDAVAAAWISGSSYRHDATEWEWVSVECGICARPSPAMVRKLKHLGNVACCDCRMIAIGSNGLLDSDCSSGGGLDRVSPEWR